MILVITHKRDFTADYVINKFNKLGIAYKRLNCEDILKYEYLFEFQQDFKYSLLNVQDYKSVWFRRTMFPDLNDLNRSEKIYILNELDSLFSNLYELINSKWLSAPKFVYRAENKLLQLKTASELGWKIPPTIVTNSLSLIREFYYQHSEDIVVKPLANSAIDNEFKNELIFTSKVTNKEIEQLDDFDMTPCIFQKNIKKEYEIRVTVVGNKLFSASIDSQIDDETKVDWRRKMLQFKPIELPIQIQNLCFELVRNLGLNFGAIDLIKTPNDDYIFLEINPNGQWVWIENQTGLKISDSVIEFLNS